jgi:hypothetical protein
MTVYHSFKRLSQKLAIRMHKAMDPTQHAQPTEFEFETLAICRSLINRSNSELLISPLSGKRFIKNSDSQIYFIIQDGMVDIINHTYSYNVKITLKAYQRLVKAFDMEVESRRQEMEDEIRSNVKHSLKTIFQTLSNETI